MVMVVVKRWQPKAFFSFCFTRRLIVSRVRRKRKRKKRNTKTTMMVVVVVVRSSRVLRTTVRTSTNEALPPLDDVVDIQHVLSHDMLMLHTVIFGRCCEKKERNERKKEKNARKKIFCPFSFFFDFYRTLSE